MAVSTTFSGAKLEALLLKCSSSSSSPPPSRSSFTTFPGQNRRTLIQRGVIRCDAQPSDASSVAPNNATALSALEQLKTSAADSNSSSIFSHCLQHLLDWLFPSLHQCENVFTYYHCLFSIQAISLIF